MREKRQGINQIDEMAAPLLSRLVIISTPEGPHFRATLEMMVKEWHRRAHVINIPPVYHETGDPCDLFPHRSIAREDRSSVLGPSFLSRQSLAQNKAGCPNRELIPHLKHETRDSENRHVETRGESGENAPCLQKPVTWEYWGKNMPYICPCCLLLPLRS